MLFVLHLCVPNLLIHFFSLWTVDPSLAEQQQMEKGKERKRLQDTGQHFFWGDLFLLKLFRSLKKNP